MWHNAVVQHLHHNGCQKKKKNHACSSTKKKKKKSSNKKFVRNHDNNRYSSYIQGQWQFISPTRQHLICIKLPPKVTTAPLWGLHTMPFTFFLMEALPQLYIIVLLSSSLTNRRHQNGYFRWTQQSDLRLSTSPCSWVLFGVADGYVCLFSMHPSATAALIISDLSCLLIWCNT